MERLLQFFFAKIIRRGAVTLKTASGREIICGDGTGKPVTIRFARTSTPWRILGNPELRFGEAYTDGEIIFERGDLTDLFAAVMSQSQAGQPAWFRPYAAMRRLLRHVRQFNPRGRAKATSRIITTSTAAFTRCFSIPTGNTAAPISSIPACRSTRRSSPRNGISPPS
jgi:cyclopropane-fatty-acyl-phospholipid synthase